MERVAGAALRRAIETATCRITDETTRRVTLEAIERATCHATRTTTEGTPEGTLTNPIQPPKNPAVRAASPPADLCRKGKLAQEPDSADVRYAREAASIQSCPLLEVSGQSDIA